MAARFAPLMEDPPRRDFEPAESDGLASLWDGVKFVLRPLASLRLTVVLFALSIVLIFIGTLAQVNEDIWQVVDKYFRSWIAWVPLKVFFPPSFFPGVADRISDRAGFPFPGGAPIGLMLFVNLLAAHLVRFTIQTRGLRLVLGLAVLAVGTLMTWLVVVSGSNTEGIHTSLVPYDTLWLLFHGAMFVLSIAGVVGYFQIDRQKKLERYGVLAGGIAAGFVVLTMLVGGDSVKFDESSMRILWQLIKGGFAATVLLIGCIMLFRKRAGIVLLHGGIGLMMLGELFVSLQAVETQMSISEGESSNFAQDIREIELAVVDPSDAETDEVVAIRKSRLLSGGNPAPDRIEDDYLPFDVQVDSYFPNAMLRQVQPGETTPATAGDGKHWRPEPQRASTGTDTDGGVDLPAMYVTFYRKGTEESLGTYLVSVQATFANIREAVEVDGRRYLVGLRFRRYYKDYTIELLDVRKDDYVGTNTPRNYSSDVRVVDPTRDVNREVRIWMNNPLRFAGENFYQSGYHRDPTSGVETTTLQIVNNDGWMIPYVSCVIVGVGMLFQFGLVLLRHLNRQIAPNSTVSRPADGPITLIDWGSQQESPGFKIAGILFPIVIVAIFAGWLGSKARPPRPVAGGVDYYQAGKIPVTFQGRVKPLDTLARNTLRVISDRETIKFDEQDAQPKGQAPKIADRVKQERKQQREISATQWLLEVVDNSERADSYPIFRIDNPDVLSKLGLERRPGLRYSVNDLRDKIETVESESQAARKREPERRTVYERRMLELERRLRAFVLLIRSFRPVDVELPEPGPNFDSLVDRYDGALKEHRTRLMELEPPLVVPVIQPQEPSTEQSAEAETFQWLPYSAGIELAEFKTQLRKHRPDDPRAATADAVRSAFDWKKILETHARGDAVGFNAAVASYLDKLQKSRAEGYGPAKVHFESFFNHLAPFYHAAALYVIAFLLGVASWLGWSRPLSRASFWLIVFTATVHALALIGRIYISGRPPVTNLYSSAVFIGFAGVIFGIVFEAIYKLGIGNVLAAPAGFAALLVAHFLAGDGDTFTVLQAVLDTQFWLATHVVIITLGYAATFVAGFLGLIYIFFGMATSSLTQDLEKTLTRMIYGSICFAIFFSFIGTVLGGLWADDSWGRFWGWDPKENGALIIVIWNALVLHARWGAMIKGRGLAVLAVGGNIVTAWSWFGVNELGVGLHSYGFTEGVLLALSLFCVSQLAVMGVAMLPRWMWWSVRQNGVQI